MCGVCGCGQAGTVERSEADHGRDHDDQHDHEHVDEHGRTYRHRHTHANDDTYHESRLVRVERDLLEKNDRYADMNRSVLAKTQTLALNLTSSPGSGKTTLLVRTLTDLRAQSGIAVVEGDQQTALDAERVASTGVPVLQINTGKVCHLDAAMIHDALTRIRVPARGVLFIENVGNLVCPSGFDLGEAAKVVLCSVTEGEDKPLKYPDMFHAAGLVLVTKVDLLPHLEFDIEQLVANCRRINPRAPVLRVSTRTGEGLVAWYEWIKTRLHEVTSE